MNVGILFRILGVVMRSFPPSTEYFFDMIFEERLCFRFFTDLHFFFGKNRMS
ncbi:hypothetical protein LEP1GSC170_2977 [Leptospira interrogans serovar Bataviae str. HAI135]|nr:hypothetical protein LEP1GSC170_2977 [Leptospira interrogans serovar Bataviae str. HAI135]